MVPSITNGSPAKVTWRSILRSRIAFVFIIFTGFLGAAYVVVSRPHTFDGLSYSSLMSPPADLDPPPDAPPPALTRTRPPHIKYTTVHDFFLQSEEGVDPKNFDYRRANRGGTIFGLKIRPYDTDGAFRPGNRYSHLQWPRFEYYANKSAEQSPEHQTYKVLLIGRHGEGWHNVAEAKYGTVEWDEYWSRHDNFTDPHLTPNGYMQAQDASAFWQSAIKFQRIPTPESYYVSPLARCLSTAMLTYSSLEVPKWRPFHATVKELLRETLGVHTCDRRSTRTWIAQHFSGFNIEPGFTEADELWDADVRETPAQQTARAKLLLDEIFNNDNGTFVSLTTHSGMIRSILEIVGHREWELNPGDLMPVFVRAEWYGGSEWEERPEVPPPRGQVGDGSSVEGGGAGDVAAAAAGRARDSVGGRRGPLPPLLPGDGGW